MNKSYHNEYISNSDIFLYSSPPAINIIHNNFTNFNNNISSSFGHNLEKIDVFTARAARFFKGILVSHGGLINFEASAVHASPSKYPRKRHRAF